MSTTERRTGSSPPTSPTGESDHDLADWPVQAAGSIVEMVDKVRDRTTGRAVTIARGIVFGLLITVLAVIAGITAMIFLVRSTQVSLTWVVDRAGGELPHSRAVWISYLVVGAVFTVGGAVVWRVANRRATALPTAEPGT